MKKLLTLVGVLSISSTVFATEVLYGMSLQKSALIIEDYQSEGYAAERVPCGAVVASAGGTGNYCVVARK